MFVNMADLRVGFLCRHEVIRDVDIEQEVIHELVTAWRESNTVLLPILVKIDSASSVKRILVCNFLQDPTVLLLDRPRMARREKRPKACILPSKVRYFPRDVYSTKLKHRMRKKIAKGALYNAFLQTRRFL